jgi:hypothetical protein
MSSPNPPGPGQWPEGQPPYQAPYQPPYSPQQPYNPQQAYQPAPSLGGQADGSKGFFGALFDFSFNSFVTPKIVKLVYVLATIAIALGYLVFVVAGFKESPGVGIVVLLLGAVAAIIYLAFVRMTLEFYYAIVRMSEDINRRLPRS